MQKDRLHINKTSHRLGSGLFLAVICLCLLASCAKDEALLPAEDNTCRATLRLNVSSFGQQGTDGTTRSVAGNTDEDLVKDLWVFQFSTVTDSLLKEPVYFSESQLKGNTDEIELDFIQNGPGESSIVCVVANTHDSNWATDEFDQVKSGFESYPNLRQQALPDGVSTPFLSVNMGETGGFTVPMYGESAETVIADRTYIRVPLVRMFARVHVSVDPSYPYAHHLSIKSITYSNVPLHCRVKEITKTEEYPNDIEWKEYVEEGANEYILYMPENRQGVMQSITDKSKADPDQFPEHALTIKIDMIHTPMSEIDNDDNSNTSHTHEYTVYPGGDMKNDFNIKRNYIYNVIIKIISEPGQDTILPEP